MISHTQITESFITGEGEYPFGVDLFLAVRACVLGEKGGTGSAGEEVPAAVEYHVSVVVHADDAGGGLVGSIEG